MRKLLLSISLILLASIPVCAQDIGGFFGPSRTIKNGTTDPTNCTVSSNNVFYNTSSGLLKLCTASNTWSPIPVTTGTAPAQLSNNVYRVAADFTTAANTSLQAITGLVITLPANTARTYQITCDLTYSQATAAVADQFGIQAATFAPTNIWAKGEAFTSATAVTAGNFATLATTTATPIVTFTPSAITTIWNAHLAATVENPSNASAQTLNIMVQTSTAADAITVKRGSQCTAF